MSAITAAPHIHPFPDPLTRTIVHLDLDCFFVAVERLRDHRLRNQPVIVGGLSDRGVVCSASYEARRVGVHAGMSIRYARQLCPEAILLQGDYQAYTHYSDIVRDMVRDAVPVMEMASIDEVYIDLTGFDKFFGCWQFARELRQRIMRETGLDLSMGQANCKAVAKVSTGEAKPRGVMQILRGDERAFLAPMPLQKLPGAGAQTCKLLGSMGVKHIRTVQDLPVDAMEDVLGATGRTLWLRAQAADPAPVQPYNERKSISTEETFDEDTTDVQGLRAMLVTQVERIAFQLRAEGKLTACVSVKIKYADFNTEIKQQRIAYTAQDDVLIDVAKQLFQKVYQRRVRIRLLGVSLSHLVPGGIQLNLLEDTVEKAALLEATDRMKHRYGWNAVLRATALQTCGRSNEMRRLLRREMYLPGARRPQEITRSNKGLADASAQ